MRENPFASVSQASGINSQSRLAAKSIEHQQAHHMPHKHVAHAEMGKSCLSAAVCHNFFFFQTNDWVPVVWLMALKQKCVASGSAQREWVMSKSEKAQL